ncbi:MAG: hypothetical protein RL230_2884 [Pseudomonadota bacterium]
MKAAVIIYPGSNCDRDCKVALERSVDAQVSMVWHKETSLPEGLDLIVLPGGFSYGDYLRCGAMAALSPVTRAVVDAAKAGVPVLGICNGFQALIKTGLVPYGEIRDAHADAPTLVHNAIGRHISCYAKTSIVSTLSPWLSNNDPGDIHAIPLSHGEGRFYASPEIIASLAATGQIATQYCDADGVRSMDIAINPNGSLAAIEGITSPCGRVLGKMGHSERAGSKVAKNIPGEKHQPIFTAGVGYFQV